MRASPRRFGRRLIQLLVGLVLYGVSMALLVRSGLGVDPWDVFHQGLANHVPLSFGQVTIAVGALVLLLWIPLRQRPGLGTLLNVIVIGLVANGIRQGHRVAWIATLSRNLSIDHYRKRRREKGF